MCIVSATYQAATTVPIQQWTWPVYNEFQDIIKRLDSLDKKLGQPDCHDPAKALWMKEIEQRLKEVEQASLANEAKPNATS